MGFDWIPAVLCKKKKKGKEPEDNKRINNGRNCDVNVPTCSNGENPQMVKIIWFLRLNLEVDFCCLSTK